MKQIEHTPSPEKQETARKRPIAITVICIMGFIGAVFTIPLLFSNAAKLIGNWYPPYLGLSAVVGIISMVGLWKMKKWAAYLYAAFVVINQIVLLVMGVWNILALLMPAVVTVIAFAHIRKMD